MKIGNGRNNFWFGTEERMAFLPTPLRGAVMSPESTGVSGTLINGTGFARNARSSHKTYVFEWQDSSAIRAAALMKSYYDGTYGRGLIYFLDPLIYDKNVAPARWADPSIACDDEGPSLVYGVRPERVLTSGWETNDLPVYSAYYNLADVASGYRGGRDTLFIPIPTGFTLYVGAFHSTTGDGVIEAYPVDNHGVVGSPTVLTEVASDATDIVPDTFTGGRGVRIQVGKSDSGAGAVTFTGFVARLYPTGLIPPASFSAGPWMGGLGHAGVRFTGPPTYVANTGVNGGQVGYAASFKEVLD